MSERQAITEWRVESDTLEDEFGADEDGAREWLEICNNNPDWEPSKLMRRTVVIETGAWEPAQ